MRLLVHLKVQMGEFEGKYCEFDVENEWIKF